ncbi:hypothetical protein LUZ63_022156 [Rhynchospora breviuscula]|uniref:DUF805 domain-containing protein n=1 Tax=Rhynchospora breviuscula TaxID=2022672 RepID=A0A9P9Z5D3_9POAL|nr:hypothetical protein LUZ63_022156 [Rhynchospora breviuscula]
MTNPTSAPSLDQPYYGAPLKEAVRRFFQKYATFTGRASRSEFWWWILVAAIVNFVLNLLASIGGFALKPNGEFEIGGFAVFVLIVAGLWGLATIVPQIALTVRRLHDTNRSGFWYFIVLIPLIGSIVLLVFLLLDSDPQGARFDR